MRDEAIALPSRLEISEDEAVLEGISPKLCITVNTSPNFYSFSTAASASVIFTANPLLFEGIFFCCFFPFPWKTQISPLRTTYIFSANSLKANTIEFSSCSSSRTIRRTFRRVGRPNLFSIMLKKSFLNRKTFCRN